MNIDIKIVDTKEGNKNVTVVGFSRWGKPINASLTTANLFDISRFIDKYIDGVQDDDGDFI